MKFCPWIALELVGAGAGAGAGAKFDHILT